MVNSARWLVVVVIAALLAAPGVSLAQGFPSQQGGRQQPASGELFESRDFGFSLYLPAGSPWSVDGYIGGPGEGIEGVSLWNGTSVVYLFGVNNSNSPQAIVETVAGNLAVPMSFLEVVTDEPTVAAAYFVSDDANAGARIFAAKLSPSTAFVIAWIFPPMLLQTESDDYNRLMDGVEF